MNLITRSWLPVRTPSGRRYIRPDQIGEPDVLALDFPRPDMNGSVAELLIGLLSTFDPPADEREWRERWGSRQVNAEALAVGAPAFAFERFAQEYGLPGEPLPIENIFVDALAGAEAGAGRDVMNRAGAIAALSPTMALAAVWTLQAYAIVGGSAPDAQGKRRGYFTSARRGGPLTTIVQAGTDLWGLIWPNIETRHQIAARAVGAAPADPLSALPWMRSAPCLLTPDGAHPCTIYWAIPRRIRLELSPAGGEVCSLTGEASEHLVRSYVRVGGGFEFDGWESPLSPYEQQKDGAWVARRARPERIGVRHWLGYVVDTPKRDLRPARVVSHARVHRAATLGDLRLLAHGFATDKKVVHAWTQSALPLVTAAPDVTAELDLTARGMVIAATEAAAALRAAVYICEGPSWQAETELWTEIEAPFLDVLRRVPAAVASDALDPTLGLRAAWATTLRRTAYRLFDRHADFGSDPARNVKAQYGMARKLRAACIKHLQLTKEKETANADGK